MSANSQGDPQISTFDFGGDESDTGEAPPLLETEPPSTSISLSPVTTGQPSTAPQASPSPSPANELSDDDLTITSVQVSNVRPARSRLAVPTISFASQLRVLPHLQTSVPTSPYPSDGHSIAASLPQVPYAPYSNAPQLYPTATQACFDILPHFPSPFAAAQPSQESMTFLSSNNFAPVFAIPPVYLVNLCYSPILVTKHVVANVQRGLFPLEGLHVLHKGRVAYPMLLSTTGTPRVASNADNPIALSSDSDDDDTEEGTNSVEDARAGARSNGSGGQPQAGSAAQGTALLDPLRYQRELSDEQRRRLLAQEQGADGRASVHIAAAASGADARMLQRLSGLPQAPGSPFYSPTGNVLWSLLPETRDSDLYLHSHPPGPAERRVAQPRFASSGITGVGADEDDEDAQRRGGTSDDDLEVTEVHMPPSAQEQARIAAEVLRSVGVPPESITGPHSRPIARRSRHQRPSSQPTTDSQRTTAAVDATMADAPATAASGEHEDTDSGSDDGTVTRPDAKRIRVSSSSVPPVQSSLAAERGNEDVISRLSQSLMCPVCLGPVTNIVATKCGHIFCKECVRRAVALQKACPTCRNPLVLGDIHRLFF